MYKISYNTAILYQSFVYFCIYISHHSLKYTVSNDFLEKILSAKKELQHWTATILRIIITINTSKVAWILVKITQ